MAARLRGTRRRGKALERAGGEQSRCPAPGLLPALQLRLSRFFCPVNEDKPQFLSSGQQMSGVFSPPLAVML